MSVENIRNMAIIAHANHGKSMLREVLVEALTGQPVQASKDKTQTKTNYLVTLHYRKPRVNPEVAHDFLNSEEFCTKFKCEDCGARMQRKDYEFICPNCGLAILDNLDFQNIENYNQLKNRGTPVYAHNSNEPQTMPCYKWVNGRFKLLIPK